MPQLALISDTHIPQRAEAIPDVFLERLRAADHVIHAGDFTASEVLETLRELFNGHLTAVHGNMDSSTLGLPAVATHQVDAVPFVVTHGTGSPHTYEERVARTVINEAGTDAVGLAGHTHEVLDTTVNGIRILNPGSATGAAPADRTTMMTLSVSGDSVDAVVHEA